MTQMDVQPPTAESGGRDRSPDPMIEMHDISITFGAVRALDGVSPAALPRRGARADGRERRRQVDADQGADRRLHHRRRHRPGRRRASTRSPRRPRPRPPASARSTRRSTWSRTSPSPRTCCSAASPAASASINVRAMNRRARATLERLGLDIDPASVLGEHPIAIQQLVAIARAVDVEARVLILDEPTSSLDADEVAKLFEVMRTLREQGVAIVFVSHFLDQIYEIADRMTILRNGGWSSERMVADTTQLELVKLMIGRELEVLDKPRPRARRHRAPRRARRSSRRSGSAARARWRPPTSSSTRARSSASPACSARAAPSWPGCSSAPTPPTPARSPSAPSGAGCAARGTPSTARSPSPARTARPRASSAT